MKLDDLTAFCLLIVLLGIWGFAMCGITVCLGIAWLKSMLQSGIQSIKDTYYAYTFGPD